ncbi:hypothetical protein [Lacticaseibacillus porcinae]|uniref:hypothetical protein n=1 Tax=Lacticaseibacillus porcinae TaxID=1123687 RepID=UPI000F78F00D|nr:hypothetical protein [Lacticaseibacillus porcinae]
MAIWIIGILLVIVIAIAVIRWRVARRKRAMKVLMRHNQKACDEAVTQALTQLGVSSKHDVSSQPVADVWGHGIMAFEYQMPKVTPPIALDRFEQALHAQTSANNENSTKLSPSLVVTDWWTRDEQVHFDVAYVSNAATREYVQDVRRV